MERSQRARGQGWKSSGWKSLYRPLPVFRRLDIRCVRRHRCIYGTDAKSSADLWLYAWSVGKRSGERGNGRREIKETDSRENLTARSRIRGRRGKPTPAFVGKAVDTDVRNRYTQSCGDPGRGYGIKAYRKDFR